jgi:PadR family transcriptional regulator PadR
VNGGESVKKYDPRSQNYCSAVFAASAFNVGGDGSVVHDALTYIGLRNIIRDAMAVASGAIREAKKGAAELVVLALLEDEDRHGYDLVRLIDERSGGLLTFNFASLYATLYKLEERSLIQGRWVERAGQRRRRYYRLTAKGGGALAAQRDEWQQFFGLVRTLAGLSYV